MSFSSINVSGSLAGSEEHATPDLRVMSLSPLGVDYLKS